jgi:hypothetical protein
MKNIFKNISLYFTYKQSLRKIKKQLMSEYSARVDRVGRIYTVINIPVELIEPYNMRKSDIDNVAQNFVREYTSALSKFLNSNGLFELYDFYDIEKVEKYSYLVVFGFSLFNTQKVARNLMFWVLPSILIISTLSWLYFRHH